MRFTVKLNRGPSGVITETGRPNSSPVDLSTNGTVSPAAATVPVIVTIPEFVTPSVVEAPESEVIFKSLGAAGRVVLINQVSEALPVAEFPARS